MSTNAALAIQSERIDVQEYPTPEEFADKLLVRPAGGGNHYFDGITNLNDVIISAVPIAKELPNVLKLYRLAVQNKHGFVV